MRLFSKKVYFNKNNPVIPIVKGIFVTGVMFSILIAGFYFFTDMQTFSMAADVVNIGLEGVVSRTNPEKTLFTFENMAPGNQKSAYLTVYNEGQIDFLYPISASMESGSEMLYNVLDLKIQGSDGSSLYTGKIKDLKDIPLGNLSPGTMERLHFLIGFPIDCGMEYQNLNTAISFLLNAQECIFTGKVVWEPPLDEADVNVRNGGIIPIRFHLENNGIYDTVKRGLDLIITGQDIAGQPVVYIFRVQDGTLIWQATSQKPHYELPLLDTQNYPVKPDTYYTATVKHGDRVLGSTRFLSGK